MIGKNRHLLLFIYLFIYFFISRFHCTKSLFNVFGMKPLLGAHE